MQDKKKEYIYFIPFEHCKIAGDIFTILAIGESSFDKDGETTYWSHCERAVVCKELGLGCFYTKRVIDWDVDLPFDIGQMTDYILKNGNKIEYDHFDGLDMILFYLWEGKYSEQKLIKSLQLHTGVNRTTKKSWLKWRENCYELIKEEIGEDHV